MARGVNRVTLIGNLGQDPDVHHTGSGNTITKISIATSEQWKDKQTGEKQERATWHRVVFFGRLAEIAGEYLRKGAQVYVEGRLSTSTYEKEGQTHYATDIIANEMQMLGGRGNGGESRSVPAPSRNAAPTERSGGYNTRPQGEPEDFDDDIPF